MFFFLNEFFPKMYFFFFLLKLVTYFEELGKETSKLMVERKQALEEVRRSIMFSTEHSLILLL